MNIATIKQHVTHFSEELRHKARHEENVVIGGAIQNIVPPIDEAFPMYIVTLDDLVGISYVVVPSTMIDAYMEDFQIGNFIFIEGFVNIVTRPNKKDISVFAYSMKDITKVGDTSK